MSTDSLIPSFRLSEPDGGRRRLGALGERAAGRFLERRGFRIRARGFRARVGEIDLVAEDGEAIVFVEVKTRRTGSFGDPLEAITAAKRRRMIRAASLYLEVEGLGDRPCRFDLVTVRVDPSGGETIEHLPDAFDASNCG